MQLQAALEEDTIAIQIQIHTALVLRVQQMVAHPTIDRLDQVMEQHVRPLMTEPSPMVTILEALRADLVQTHLATALRADLVLVQAIVLQVEVRVDPQAAQAQEDPEEGGINSPFFFAEIIRKS